MDLQFCFVARCPQGRRVAPHTHPSLELVYCTEGRGRTAFAKRSYEVRPLTFALIPAGVPHDQDNHTAVVTICMGVDGSGLERFAGVWPDPGGILQGPLAAMNRELRTKARGYDVVARGLMYEVVGLAQRQILSEEDGPTPHKQHIVQRAIEIIQRREGAITVAQVAEQLFVSTDYLRHLFQERAQIPPMRCILEARLEKARSLLRQPGISVGEVAQRCGFDSLHYFSRFFRKAMGRTPTDYRLDQIGGTAGAGRPGRRPRS